MTTNALPVLSRTLAQHEPAPVRLAVRVSDHLDAAEWDSYASGHHDATIDHLSGWRTIFTRVFGQRAEYLVARRGPEVVGILPLVLFRSMLFGRFGVSVPYLNYGGMLTSDGDAADALVARAVELTRAFGGSHLELRHQARRLPDAVWRQHKVRMVLPLPTTEDDLWKALDRKVRNQVRKAQKEGLTIHAGGAELLPDFYDVFARNMRDLGTPVHSLRFFQAVTREFAQAEVVVIRHLGITVAASITLRFRDTVIVPWASSLREARPLCPNMLLYWAMLGRAIESGARAFDFGRSTRGAGTHQFKLQWGATEVPLHWEYVLLSRPDAPDQGTSNATYGRLVTLWQRIPVPVTRLIGPPIAANIP